MSADQPAPELDLCPMCAGDKVHSLKPPYGFYVKVWWLDINRSAPGFRILVVGEKEIHCEDGIEAPNIECMKWVNKLAGLGYRLAFCHGEPKLGKSWMMEWQWQLSIKIVKTT